MAKVQTGSASIEIPDTLQLPEKAGHLSPIEVQRMPRARLGVGLVCEAVADMLERHPDRLTIPGVDAATLRTAGQSAEAYEPLIVDVEALAARLRQANLIADSEAHELLRRAINALRAQEKFDPALASLLPQLTHYFR